MRRSLEKLAVTNTAITECDTENLVECVLFPDA